MDAKLEREVDVEGTVDMMVVGEEIGRANDRPSISRRPGSPRSVRDTRRSHVASYELSQSPVCICGAV
jgi:hypothetical protein